MKLISKIPIFIANTLNYRHIFMFLCLTIFTALSAQVEEDKLRGRVGINTVTPRATLEIHKKDPSELVSGVAQGVIFPRFTTEERRQFSYDELTDGLMIYNTTKKCIELCFEYEGKLIWKCLSKDTPSKVIITNYFEENSLIKKTFIINYSGFEFNIGNPLPMISWPERVVEKEVEIGGQKETLILTIPAGSVGYGSSIYLENAELKTKSGNPIDLTNIANYEKFAEFDLYLDDDYSILLNIVFSKYTY